MTTMHATQLRTRTVNQQWCERKLETVVESRLSCASQIGPFEAGYALGGVGAACTHVFPLQRTQKQFHALNVRKHILRKEMSRSNEKKKGNHGADPKTKKHEKHDQKKTFAECQIGFPSLLYRLRMNENKNTRASVCGCQHRRKR